MIEGDDDDQIPDDLARGLDGIAGAQHKSVEQVALESLRSLFDRAYSPEILLQSLRQLSHPSAEAVDDLDAAIVAGRAAHGRPGRLRQMATWLLKTTRSAT